MVMDLWIVIMSIFQWKTFDNSSIFSHMFTKLPKITEKKNHRFQKKCKNFSDM